MVLFVLVGLRIDDHGVICFNKTPSKPHCMTWRA
jgi:hypothetical protein